MAFVNRERELSQLERWWQADSVGRIGMVWGRRRVGKTELIRHFAVGKRMVYHVSARRPLADELRSLSREASVVSDHYRDLSRRPFADWEDALDWFAAAAGDEPLLLVLDEFPELIEVVPELPSVLRALWDRVRSRTRLRLLICGSAVRTMQSLQEQREPLYGRFDLSLLLQPFQPHEAARMLPSLTPVDRALVWGIVGGVPQYLAWWDQSRTVAENLEQLLGATGGWLLSEGELVMATEGGSADLASQVLYAIAAGRSRFNEIENAVRTDPARTLERLRALHLVERTLPVTENETRTRRRAYHVSDNFLAFWLALIAPHRGQIDLGLGPSIVPVITSALDDHMGFRWEVAFRAHLRRLANQGELGEGIVAVGPFWTSGGERRPSVEIDAVALAGRSREAILVGEAKWTRSVDATRLLRDLERKAESLPARSSQLRYAVAAREEVSGGEPDLLRVTASDIFPD